MCNIGIFFGSDTGNTKKNAYLIKDKISKYFNTKIFNISQSFKKDFLNFDIFILGTSTWYLGELQYDWINFLDILKKINFKNKIVALFGCGDQRNYKNSFCDAVYELYKIVYKKKPIIIGYWSTNSYIFNYSKSLLNKKNFIGLMLDEHNQFELSKRRISIWVSDLIVNIYNFYINKLIIK